MLPWIHRRRGSRLPWRKRLLRWLLRRPPAWLRLLQGGLVIRDGRPLEPALGVVARYLARGPQFHDLSPEDARRQLAKRSALVADESVLMDRVEDRTIPGPGGELPIRVYTPADLPYDPPAVVYFHGGGWVLGSLDSHDSLCRVIAGQTPAKVVAVDYRLAPEHRFPAAFRDALAAFRWVAENAPALGVDPARIAVAGDSAGANLATVVALATRGDTVSPAAQLLFYPVTDGRRNTLSYETYASGFGLSRATMNWFFSHYLPDPELIEDPRVSPLLAEDLAGSPPAIVVTAGFDVLRDEGDAYAERLRAAGVEVVHQRFGRLLHAFANMTAIEPCRRALDEMISELARRLHALSRPAGSR